MESFDLRQWSGFAAAGGDTSCAAVIDQIVIDSRRLSSANGLFVALPGISCDGHNFVCQAANKGARYALVHKGWHPHAPCDIKLLHVDNPLASLQQIAASYRNQRKATVVAITGSLGKTMLKDLLFLIATGHCRAVASPESFNSQIGVAISLLSIAKEHQIAIIEAGISQPGEMAALATMIAPDHVIVTNIAEQHLASLQNLTTIAREKLSLAAQLPPHGWLLAPDVPTVRALDFSKQPVYWNIASPELPHAHVAHQQAPDAVGYTLTFPDGRIYNGRLPHSAHHHVELITIAAKAAHLLSIPADRVIQALQDYRFETTRTEVWHSSKGATLINSPYSADPQSVDIALRRLDESPPNSRKIFVFGGLRSGNSPNSHRRIGEAIRNSAVDALVLFGNEDFTPLIDSLKAKSALPIDCYGTLGQALQEISRSSKPDDCILLKGPRKPSLHEAVEAFGEDIAPNICTINLEAVRFNLENIRQCLPSGMRIMAVVKALAYGTADVRMAKFLRLCGVDILGVAFLDEGINLKRAGVSQAVFALNALPSEASKAVKWDIEVGVSEPTLVTALAEEAHKQDRPVKVHLHIDTGMGRFGCRPENALSLAQHIRSYPMLKLEGVMTHFTSAENPAEDAFTQHQYHSFQKVISTLEADGFSIPWCHAANSAASIRHHLPGCNMARVGLAIYGLHGSPATRQAIDLKLAVSLTSRIVGINHIYKGETLGYGRSYRAKRDHEVIAILPLGYFDGLHRQYSGKGHVLIRGQRAPMIGNICMDYMMIDVTDLAQANIGDDVLIFGHDALGHFLAPEDLANSIDSIAHQLVSCLGPRVKRLFIYE